MENITNESILLLTLRIILGILFFFHGYDKIFKLGMKKVITSYETELDSVKMPHFIVSIAAIFTSFVELLGGIMIILGLYTHYALAALGVDLIMVVFIFSLMQPLWDMKLVFPRIILWSIIMFLPKSYDLLSIDHLILHRF